MFYVSKRMEISGSHCLSLDYPSPCSKMHGHNWIVTVHCKSDVLDDNGMVVDFAKIKAVVHGAFDHKHFNDIVDFNPTAENLARYICENVPNCWAVDVQESEGNHARFELPG